MSLIIYLMLLFWLLFDCDLEVIDKFLEEYFGCVFLGFLMEVFDNLVFDILLLLLFVVRIFLLFFFIVLIIDDEIFVVCIFNEGDDVILMICFGEGRGEFLMFFLLLDEGDGFVFLSLNFFLIFCNRWFII